VRWARAHAYIGLVVNVPVMLYAGSLLGNASRKIRRQHGGRRRDELYACVVVWACVRACVWARRNGRLPRRVDQPKGNEYLCS